jgi:VWFA-related protein
MSMTRRLFVAASAAAICRAQDPVFSADSRVVTLLASVRDSSGRLIPDLTRDDFWLREEGNPVEIRYFSRETDLPLTVGLLIDTSKSQMAVLERERRGAYAFLERVLRPDRDSALVMSFDAKVKVLCRPTAALPDLQKGLTEANLPLRTNPRKKAGPEPKKKDIAGGTKLQTSVRQCADEFMRKAQGRKAMLLLTDGVDEGSRTTLDEAIEHAQRSDTLVYSILYADPNGHGRKIADSATGLTRMGLKGRRILTELARQTGGGFYIVTPDHPLEQILDEIQAELRTQYSVGFIPAGFAAGAGSGEYRAIALGCTRPGLVVRAREGYYAR